MENVLLICNDNTVSHHVKQVLGAHYHLNLCADFQVGLRDIKSRRFIPDIIILYSFSVINETYPTALSRKEALCERREIITVLREREGLRIPIIVLSDEADGCGLLQAVTLSFGATDYISLQLSTPEMLKAKLRNYLKLHFDMQAYRVLFSKHRVNYNVKRQEFFKDFLPRVLVVEDDQLTVETLQQQLCDLHFHGRQVQFSFVQTRDEVFDLIHSNNTPHLILLDINLGHDECGTAIFDELKESPKTHHIQIAYITSEKCLEDAEEELNSGALDYIIKPIKYPALRARIVGHLGWSYEYLFFQKLKLSLDR